MEAIKDIDLLKRYKAAGRDRLSPSLLQEWWWNANSEDIKTAIDLGKKKVLKGDMSQWLCRLTTRMVDPYVNTRKELVHLALHPNR